MTTPAPGRWPDRDHPGTIPAGRSGAGSDSGSIAFALLLMLVGMMLSGLLVPMVLTQTRSTTVDVLRVHALSAAQTGVDVALGHIRAANDGAGRGVLAGLPCGPLMGTVGVGGSATYQVDIDYFAVNPRGASASWIATNRIQCIPGAGAGSTPSFALLRSQGTDRPSADPAAVATRSLQVTYTFSTTNENIPGGLIHIYLTATSTDLCMDGGSGSPAAGTNLQMQPCVPGSLQQKFAYESNLTLVLVASKSPILPLGMCLDAGAPHALGAVVQFQPCGTTTQPRQQWSINDSANFEGTADGIGLDGYCFNVQLPDSPGSAVVLGSRGTSSCSRGYDNIETFSPEAMVGAGAAGGPANQLVDFTQFGRCLDVTEQNVNFGYLIAWPCKQAPDPTKILWNQKWSLPAIVVGPAAGTARITTNAPAGLYCLQSPRSTAAYQYVTVVPCPAGSTAATTWTVYGDTQRAKTSYTIEDIDGNCLAPTDPTVPSPDLYPKGQLISKIVMAACTGFTLQKWNAPPSILQPSPLIDIGEK